MKAIIVDDEKRSADNLRMLILENCPELEIAAICHDAKDAIEYIRKIKPAIVFLDIQMPFADGFSVVDAVKEISPKVIFTTAFSEYAVKAFRVEACDYLLKPVDPQELKDAVERAKSRVVENDGLVKRIESIEKDLRNRNAKLAVQSVEGYSLVDYTDVIRLEAASNYTHIFCRNGKKHTVARLLREFEEQLGDAGFFRIHSSHLVNLSHVVKYVRGDGGYLFMSDGGQIEVARSRKKDLMRVLLGEE
jgi:two-component system LytT family response regulator